MERQPSLPQPVMYEPDATPLVSVCESPPPASAQPHQVLVVPVWESASSNNTDASEKFIGDHAHLGQLNAASLGALSSAINLHGFTGKKVRTCWSCWPVTCSPCQPPDSWEGFY